MSKKTRTLTRESFAAGLAFLLSDESDSASHGILVALSGGPDSVALLTLLYEVAEEGGPALFAAHVNYGLRGDDSVRDEKFCVDLCRNLGIKLYRKRASYREKQDGNLQEWARQVRYRFFDSLCQKHEIDLVAIGHNRNDSVETLLMNLFRGCGTYGLSGIAVRSGRIIRPLLDFTRADILEYLKSNGIAFRTDRSNLQDKYTRNKVRLKLIPQIEKLFGATVVENIARAASISSVQQELLQSEAELRFTEEARLTPFGKIVLDLERFRGYHDLAKRLILAVAFERLTGSREGLDFAATSRVFALLDGRSTRVDFKANLFCEVSGGKIYVYKRVKKPSPISLRVPGVTSLGPYRLQMEATAMPASGSVLGNLKAKNSLVYLDADRLGSDLAVRTVRTGDRVQPLGMTGSKKVSDFFVDRKIDRPLREEIPLVVSGDEVIWIVGLEIAETVKVTEQSKQIVKLEAVAN